MRNPSVELEYEWRHNCDLLSNVLISFDGIDLPADVAENLQALIALADSYLSDGYTYRIIKDKKGDISFSCSSPDD